MKELKMFSEYIDEELNDAEKYAKNALEWKEKNRNAANMFADLASQELNHAHMLHQQAVRMIGERKERGTDVPEIMQQIWDFEHKKQIDHKARVKMMLSMYQES